MCRGALRKARGRAPALMKAGPFGWRNSKGELARTSNRLAFERSKGRKVDAGGVGGPPSLLAIAFSFFLCKMN